MGGKVGLAVHDDSPFNPMSYVIIFNKE